MIRHRRFWIRYGLATLVALAAFVLLLVLQGHFDRTFTVIYVPVIVCAAFVGGAGPALLATVLCLGISAFLLQGEIYRNPANLIDVTLFAFLGPILGYIGHRLLRETEDARYRQVQLQSILDTVPEAIIVIDHRGLMRSFSATAERLFGWSAAEVIGQNVSMLMPPPYRQEHDSYLHR